MLLYWLFDAYRSGRSKNCQNCVATPFDVLGTVRVTVSTSALLAMTRFCVFGRSVNCVVLASFLSSCLVCGGGGGGVGRRGIVDYGNSKVGQCGNKNWNNFQDRHACPQKCALTCKRLFWFAVRVCAVICACCPTHGSRPPSALALVPLPAP